MDYSSSMSKKLNVKNVIYHLRRVTSVIDPHYKKKFQNDQTAFFYVKILLLATNNPSTEWKSKELIER